MTRMQITLGAIAALTFAGSAMAQSDITKSQPKLTAPTGYPFISVIVLDRQTGGLKLCGSQQWNGDGPVTCGPLPAQDDGTTKGGITPKEQTLWRI
ncbi:hypothetical protein [Pseudooceanicola sp.]|uniref:hypothetical protein n=1 Tax=Pseudooceanicola sp. TaxID=1914328 RepID=UPI002603CC56|nr:hypothetical protein [Pseudooceanicola sp.]MDF1855389.1 hypothetical protein [Pseudooceanicola sp.]